MEFSKRLWIGMVVLGALARLLPHPWNFTPIIAIGLFAGANAHRIGTSILATLSALVLSDAVLGFSGDFWFVYAASLIPVLLGRLVRNRITFASVAASALASSISFFLITNFMVWATGHLYAKTAAGLATCFAAAIPFFQNQLLGDLLYTAVLFGGFALLTRFVRPLQPAA